MEMAPAVFEISSEDEELMPGGGAEEGGSDDNHDWLKEIVTALEKDDDDEDVVVVCEVKAKEVKSSSEIKCCGDDEDDDDDCVVLKGDPDKLKDVGDKKKGDGGDVYGDEADDEDDLQIVGEKGQIACRDYPHPRHLCIKYPFNSSPHEKHCDLCHCYVCDSVAPCVNWDTGMPNMDHCHATDKEEKWIFERKIQMSLKNSSHQVTTCPQLNVTPHYWYESAQSEVFHPSQISQFNRVPQTNLFPSHRAVQLGPNSVSCNQVLRQATSRVYSLQTHVGVPNTVNIASQSRHNQPGFVPAQCRFQPNLVAQQLNGVSLPQRAKSRNIGTLGPQFPSSHAMFKRPGRIRGIGPRSQLMCHQMINNNHAQAFQYHQNCNQVATSVHSNLTRSERLYPCGSSDSLVHQSSQQKGGNPFAANTEPAQPQFVPQAQNNLHGWALTGNSIPYDSSYVCYQGNQSGRHYDSHGIYYQSGNQIQNTVQESAHVNPEWQINLSQSNQLDDNIGALQTNQQSSTESHQLYSQITQQSTPDSSQLHIQSNQEPAVDSLGAHSNNNQQPLSECHNQQTPSNLQSNLENSSTARMELLYKQLQMELDLQCIDSPVLDLDFADNSLNSVAGGLPSQMNIPSHEGMSVDASLLNFDYNFSWNDLTPS